MLLEMAVTNPDKLSSDFAGQAEHDVARVRTAIARVIAGIPDFTYRRPSELAEKLGLDPKLAWNLGRCVDVADPFASARYLPGPTGARTFIRAARRCQVNDDTLTAAREAFESFHKLVTLHAGTRKCFNAMAAGLSTAERERSDVENRRLTFEGNRYIWGVQARTVFRINIVHPSSDGLTWDLATVRGTIDFQRMRPNVAWRFARTSSVDTSNTTYRGTRRESLDPRTNDGIPLLTEFCSQPLPEFRLATGSHNEDEFEFVASSVGNTARITCVTGEVLLSVEPLHRTELHPEFCSLFRVRTPAEVLVFDMLLHRSLFPTVEPIRAELYSDLFGAGPGPDLHYQPCDCLPLHEPVVELGPAASAAHSMDIPRYADLLQYTFERVGWNPQDFDLLRLRMQYPPIPTTVALRRPLPELPGGSAAPPA
jgi:hypothetical protein